MAKNDNCTICGAKLKKADFKENRTEHYGCRNAQKAIKKDVSTMCATRLKSANKTTEKKPGLFKQLFGITV